MDRNPPRQLPTHHPRPRIRITNADCVRALELTGYDYSLAAEALGIKESTLRSRVRDLKPHEKAFTKREVDVPTELTTMVRASAGIIPQIPDNADLAEQIIRLNREMLREGLAKAGIKPETIETLKAFDGFAKSAGDFLLGALDLTHRSVLYLTVLLIEDAKRIKREYLENPNFKDEELKLGWQEAYSDIVEKIGRSYDRTLAGTMAMAKMLGTDKGDKKKRKPGFSALKRVDK